MLLLFAAIIYTVAPAPTDRKINPELLLHRGSLSLEESLLQLGPLHFKANGSDTDIVIRIDCRSQRVKALEKMNAEPTAPVYVPACQKSRPQLYQAVQCHSTSNYCWCARVESGEPVPGTSTKGTKPDCSKHAGEKTTTTVAPKRKEKEKKRKMTVLQLNSPMQNCTPRQRTKFYSRLLAFLQTEAIANGARIRDTDSEEDRRILSAKWKFSQLDTSHNKVLEKGEWRIFKNELRQWKRVKRCARGFLKACDVDGNRRITEQEWEKCMAQDASSPSIPPAEKKNPFLYILRSD